MVDSERKGTGEFGPTSKSSKDMPASSLRFYATAQQMESTVRGGAEDRVRDRFDSFPNQAYPIEQDNSENLTVYESDITIPYQGHAVPNQLKSSNVRGRIQEDHEYAAGSSSSQGGGADTKS